jgi:hypothetical protein
LQPERASAPATKIKTNFRVIGSMPKTRRYRNAARWKDRVVKFRTRGANQP